MSLYSRKFVNPLLALSFKDGIDFVADPDYKAKEPKYIGPQQWEVLIEHDDDEDVHPMGNFVAPGLTDDDEDEEYDSIIYPKNLSHTTITAAAAKKPSTLKEYMTEQEEKLRKTKPIIAQSAPSTKEPVVNPSPEIVHLPVKLEPISLERQRELDLAREIDLAVLGIDAEQPKPKTTKTVKISELKPGPLPPTPSFDKWYKERQHKTPSADPCGKCIPCSQGGDVPCLVLLDAAVKKANSGIINTKR